MGTNNLGLNMCTHMHHLNENLNPSKKSELTTG
uniref:Uncharacterized protein n=1 Tax=Anguilla anguilla TaxID=7936 RepID=A0A0E9WBJ7_ANGAN